MNSPLLFREFRKLASDPEIDDLVEGGIDLCGTGGDKSGSFNISSAVSILLAAAGIPVIKHGNRSITSKCGSADLIEALRNTLCRWIKTYGGSA